MAIALRYAARSDIGLGRYTNNQDSGYAGPHLLVVSDGMGGHAGGDVASSVAVAAMVSLDGESHGGDALALLASTLRAANAELRRRAVDDPSLTGMGTTTTALMRYGNKLALAHIGDSRAYLLRGGELTRITHDHSFVQSLIDEGRITPDEAEHHPQRSVVTRVLTGDPDDEPDLSVREARVGDRYLICSDGLTDVVRDATIAETLAAHDDAAATADAFVQMALRGGARDNVTCVVAHVVDVDDVGAADATAPQVVGAAAVRGAVVRAPASTPAAKAAALDRGVDGTDPDEDPDEHLDEHPAPASRRRWLLRSLGALVVLTLLGAGGYAAFAWSQRQYFVGADGTQVALYRGLPQDIGPVHLSSLVERTEIPLTALGEYSREQVGAKITADDLPDARAKVKALQEEAAACQTPATASTATTPAPAPTTPTAGPTSTTATSPTTSPSTSPAATPTTATPTTNPTPARCGVAG